MRVAAVDMSVVEIMGYLPFNSRTSEGQRRTLPADCTSDSPCCGNAYVCTLDIACMKKQRSLYESVALEAPTELLYRSQVRRTASAAICGAQKHWPQQE